MWLKVLPYTRYETEPLDSRDPLSESVSREGPNAGGCSVSIRAHVPGISDRAVFVVSLRVPLSPAPHPQIQNSNVPKEGVGMSFATEIPNPEAIPNPTPLPEVVSQRQGCWCLQCLRQMTAVDRLPQTRRNPKGNSSRIAKFPRNPFVYLRQLFRRRYGAVTALSRRRHG
ncbi:hypothetical protein LX36DRAFT_655808 [Colletotrichum falcatum]|nr:hypothetical protein LX36DRAFT_655808 [Colletotrichum falcatum]